MAGIIQALISESRKSYEVVEHADLSESES
jgi:hypothetical protein